MRGGKRRGEERGGRQKNAFGSKIEGGSSSLTRRRSKDDSVRTSRPSTFVVSIRRKSRSPGRGSSGEENSVAETDRSVAQVEFRAWDPRRYFFHEPRPPLRKLLPDFRMERVANHESPELKMTGKNQEDSSSHCGVFLIFMATAAEEERAPSGGMGSWLPAIEETSEASSADRRLPYSLSRGVHFENSIC